MKTSLVTQRISNIIHAASSFYVSADKIVLFVFDEKLSMPKKLNEIWD